MKKSRLTAIMLVLFGYNTLLAQAPNGAYKATETQYGNNKQSKEELSHQSVIKLFKDGHWLVATFDDSIQGFRGTGLGTYKIVNGKYVERVEFTSWDSTAVGKTYMFDYAVNNDQFNQDGFVNSDKYQNMFLKEKYARLNPTEPLKHTGLEGTWRILNAQWGDAKLGEGEYKNVTGVKMYAYPRFAFAYYNDLTKSLVGAGGGTYQFDGSTLSENIEYFSWSPPTDTRPSFQVTVSKNLYTQTGQDGRLKEQWKRMKQDQ